MRNKLPDKERERLIVLGIFVLSYALRYIYLWQMKSSPFFFSPIMDPLFHDAWAQSIASGNWIGEGVFFRAPFYPYLLAIIYKIFGHGYVVPRLIQHLIGSFSCVLVYFLAKRMFNQKVAVVSALMAASYAMLLYFEDELLLDSLLVFFDLLLILLLLRAREVPKFSRWFVSGVVLGLSAITRPNILFFAPFVWLWIYLVFKGEKPAKRIFAYGLLFLLGCALVVFPVTLRNLLVGKDLVLIASQGGINFYIGNNENADGASAIFDNAHWEYRDFQLAAQRETGQSMSHSEISNFYYQKGISFILQKPFQAFKLLVKKLYLFWNKYEISNNQDIYFSRRYSSLIRILPLGFWLIGPLALSGMILSVLAKRRSKKTDRKKIMVRRKTLSLPVLFVFSYMATVVMFFVPARFRLPVIPILIIFSGFSLVWLYDRFRRKELSSLKLLFLILVPFLILTNSNAYHLGIGDFSRAQAHFGLGNAYLKQSELDLAIGQFDTVLVLNPGWNRAHHNRGMAFFRKGDYEEAEMEFLAEVRLNPEDEQAHNSLSALYLRQGFYDRAEEMARKAVQLGGYSANPYINLALSQAGRDSLDQAKEALRQGLSKVRPFFEGELLLGNIYQAEGQFDSAVEVYQRVVRSATSHRQVPYDLQALMSGGQVPYDAHYVDVRARAHLNLGISYLEIGESNLAEVHLKQAISLKSDLAEAHARLGILYSRTDRTEEAIASLSLAVRLEPQNATYHYSLGLAYLGQSKLKHAKDELQTTLVLDPSLTHAQEKLHLVDSLLQSEGISR